MSAYGELTLTVDGAEIIVEEGDFEFDPGGPVHKPRFYKGKMVGHSTKFHGSSLKCKPQALRDFDIDTIRNAGVVTVRVGDQNPELRGWVVPKMVVDEPTPLSGGETATWSLSLSGDAAQRA